MDRRWRKRRDLDFIFRSLRKADARFELESSTTRDESEAFSFEDAVSKRDSAMTHARSFRAKRSDADSQRALSPFHYAKRRKGGREIIAAPRSSLLPRAAILIRVSFSHAARVMRLHVPATSLHADQRINRFPSFPIAFPLARVGSQREDACVAKRRN